MSDAECVALLRWALPRLGLRWSGFRKVRGQVCKRIARRIRGLGVADVAAYRQRLEHMPEEWSELDRLCRITVSRFFRDRAMFDHLGEAVLPTLAAAAERRPRPVLRCWSAGCASGEEPYSLALLWAFELGGRFPAVSLAITATDCDRHMIERAAHACYPRATLRELPVEWIAGAFKHDGALLCLDPVFRRDVRFVLEDIRCARPEGPFDLVLCRNLAFTYFDHNQQRATLNSITARMRPGAALVVGKDEVLPDTTVVRVSNAGLAVYWKGAAPGAR